MSLDRSAPYGTVTDSDGTPGSGTIANNTFWQGFQDRIDAWRARKTITLTGNQDDLSLAVSSREADLLICNNATLLTIRGIAAPVSPAKPGKVLMIISTGAGQVDFAHENVSSAAANRLVNFATSANTSLAAGSGVAVYIYDDENSRWRLVSHEQGASITPAFAAGDFTAVTAGTWTVASGDRQAKYYLRGRLLFVNILISTSSITQSGGNPTVLQISNGQFGGFTVADPLTAPIYIEDAGTAKIGDVSTSGTALTVAFVPPAQWATATDTTSVRILASFEVT